MKSDILNIHLTNLIHRIEDSFNSLNVNASDTKWGQRHGVKFPINSTVPCQNTLVSCSAQYRCLNICLSLHRHRYFTLASSEGSGDWRQMAIENTVSSDL